MPQGFEHVARGDLSALKEIVGENAAAIHLEPILGEGGVWPHSHEYLTEAEQIARSQDILFMVDEVQSGLCRTGEWFAFQHYDLDPDVVCIAKALGNGFPIGAVWVKRELAHPLQQVIMEVPMEGIHSAQQLELKVLEIMKRDNYPKKLVQIEIDIRAGLNGLPHVYLNTLLMEPCLRLSLKQ